MSANIMRQYIDIYNAAAQCVNFYVDDFLWWAYDALVSN